MKPKRFRPGQAVTRINKDKWFFIDSGDDATGPEFGKIYHVVDYANEVRVNNHGEHCRFIILYEFDPGNWYDESEFEAVVADTKLAEDLKEIIIMK